MSSRPAPAPGWLAPHRVSGLTTTLDEVRGLAAAKREAEALVARWRHPEVVRAAGGEVPRGVLLWGPAGCGKTLLARAMASMLTAGQRPVEFYSLAASDLDAARLGELGRYLRGRGPASPMHVLYVDEIDEIGRRRDDARHTERTSAALYAALAALDGLEPASASAVFIFATNRRPAELEPALVRPGRVGVWIAVRPPSRREAEDVLRYYAVGRPVEEGLDWRRAAALARPGTSPAGLRQALDDALALALADAGPGAVIRWRHVAEAIRREGRVEDQEAWSDRRVRAVAVHESGHVAARAELGLPIRSVSLGPDGGLTDGRPDHHDEPSDEDTRRTLMDRVVAWLAGTAAEDVVLGTVTPGGSRDAALATSAARAIVATGTAGMPPVSLRAFDQLSTAAGDAAFAAVSAILTEGQHLAYALVARRRVEIEAFADILVDERDLSGDGLAMALASCGLRPADGADGDG